MVKKPIGYVYFVRCPVNGLIKIGWSGTFPNRRLSELRSGCPVPLEPVATMPGSMMDERDLHRRFHSDRSHDEWFRPSKDLDELIADADEWVDVSPHVLSPPAPTSEPRSTTKLADWALTTRLTVRGVTRFVSEWCELTGLSPQAIKVRLRVRSGVDDIFGFEGPSLILVTYGQDSKIDRETRRKNAQWKRALTPLEWLTYIHWDAKEHDADELAS